MATKKPAQGTGRAPARSPAKSPQNAADIDRRWAILLFGLGLLLAVLALVPGESGWAWVRANLLFGVFGVSAWAAGPLFLWWAVLVSMEKPVFRPLIKGVLFVFAFSGAALVFGNVDFGGLTFGEALAALLESGRGGAFGGGLASALFGGTLLALCGKLAARILLGILLVVAVMLLTGVSPADIARFFGKAGGGIARKARRELARQEAGGPALPAAPPAPPPQQQPPQQTARVRRAPAVDIPLSGERPSPRGAAGGVDVDLGPETPVIVPGNGYEQPMRVGRGGTFGGKAPQEEFGLGGDYEPLVPFGGHTPAPVPPGGAQRAGTEEKILLFGEDDPHANLGGAGSLLPQGTLLDVEYIPKDDPAFDLFGAQPGAAEQPVARQEDPPPQQGGTGPSGAAALGVSGHLAQQEDPPPQQGGTGPSGAAAPEVPTGGVRELIDRAASVTTQAAKADTRGGGGQCEPYHFPPADLFAVPPPQAAAGAKEEMQHTADLLVSTLNSFGVETRILDVARGPSVTRYEVQPQAGVKISRITNLADDIALNLAAAGVRIEAPIPGKPAVGIEVPNQVKSTVSIRSILESDAFMSASSSLSIALGKNIAGEVVVADLTKMPHLLIAGSTGSGKSVCVNSIIMSFLYKSAPEDVKMVLIDPKVVELAEYNGIPHLLIPVVTEPKMAAKALGQAVLQMEHRYHLFAEHNVRDIHSFNALARRDGTMEKLPHIAIIIDELADLMMTAGKDVENYICRIAQKARAAGMHLIVATQRPSVDVITGLIKSNIPSRIAFAVSSQVDSRTILDGAGAEKLLGMGDMLFMPIGANKPVRVQGTYVKDAEISRVIRFVKANGAAQYDDGFLAEMDKVQLSGTAGAGAAGETEESGDWLADEAFRSAVDMALEAGEISTSGLQRRLRLGYARAGRIVDQMEQMGIVSEPSGSKPRQVLIGRQQWQEMVMNAGR